MYVWSVYTCKNRQILYVCMVSVYMNKKKCICTVPSSINCVYIAIHVTAKINAKYIAVDVYAMSLQIVLVLFLSTIIVLNYAIICQIQSFITLIMVAFISHLHV